MVMAMPVDIAAEITRRLLELTAIGAPNSEIVSGEKCECRLSDREFRIATLVAKGLANRRIAEEMPAREETVRRTIRSVMKKLRAESRESIARLMALG